MSSPIRSIAPSSDSDKFVQDTIEGLRQKLLNKDGLRSPLLSFKHGGRTQRFIRVIDELPNQLFERLKDEAALQFKSLGEETDELEDEKTPSFRRALDEAKLNDPEYVQKLTELGDDPGEKALDRLEQELRERLRERLGMSPRKPTANLTVADIARRRGLDPTFDLPVSPVVPANPKDKATSKHTDSAIQTLLFEEAMQRVLLRMRERVRLSIDETGVNPLFCVFGFLEWYEAEHSETPLYAPLLLFPLEIDRELVRGRYRYIVRSSGEDVFLNAALAERLKRDFEIVLPSFDSEAGDNPEKYFTEIQKVIEQQKGWKVRRWITVGLFSFARIAMYHDLATERWKSHGGLEKHRVLNRLLGGGNNIGGNSETMAENDEGENKTHSAEFDVPLIADADSSQLAAVRDALSGRDMVINGPPGTGKSQTITNIIAAALAAGKTVLFLAEKMAALNVVKDRLTQAKLENFCLELHSTKASRKEIFGALGRRLNLPKQRSVDSTIEGVLRSIYSIRERLQGLVEALAESVGKLGITAQELFWRLQLIRAKTASLPSEVDEISILDADKLTENDLGQLVSTAEQLEQARMRVLQSGGSVKHHPWNGIAHRELDLIRTEDVVRRMERLVQAADRVEKKLQTVVALVDWPIETVAGLKSLAPTLSIPPPDPAADDNIIARMTDPQTLATLEQFAAEISEYGVLRERIALAFLDAQCADHCSSHELNALIKDAKDAKLADAAVSEVRGLAQKRQQEVAAWESAARLMAQIAVCANWSSSLTVEAERALLTAVELAVQAGPRVIANRTSTNVVVGASDTLRQGIERAKTLRERRDALSLKYAIEASGEPGVLRQYAAALRAAPFGPFAFFSKRWRQARAAYKGLCKTPGKSNRNIMASALDEIAALKDDLAAFAGDAALAQCAGLVFKGLDSDLDPLLQVADWADQVRARFSAFDLVNGHLRQVLLEASAERINGLAATATSAMFGDLQKVLRKDYIVVRTVAEQVEHAQLRSDTAQRVQAAVERLQFCPDWKLLACAALAADVAKLRELHEGLAHSRVAAGILGEKFQGHLSPTKEILASAKHVRAVIQAGLPIQLREWLLHSQAIHRLANLQPIVKEVGQVVAGFEVAITELQKIVPVDFVAWIGVASPLDARAADLRIHAERCAGNPEGLHALIEDIRLVYEVRQAGFGSLLDLLETRGEPLRDLGKTWQRVIYQSVARETISKRPALVSFTGDRHEAYRKQFRELDRQLRNLRQSKISSDLTRQPVDPGHDIGPKNQWSGRALIENETAKQKRHIAIRDLLDRAGMAVQQLMPCFMMSPLSVAQFLKPDRVKFDMVIMDEASQLRPEDALGAIARGSQVIIVGDPMQLPPTNFFMGGENSVSDDGPLSAVDEQSILDQALSIMRPKRLTWHYRSRDASLIAFSNREFYENKLVVFPAPYHNHADFGVRYEHVTEGQYRSSVNIPEARHVAAAAVEYVAKHPERSLGIVTLNQPQAEAVAMEIDRLASEHDEFEVWRRKRENSLEPFFVKNLENVQGDERDTIFISTVYGRDEQGNFFQRFGPIIHEGGHRRLNVLFTRAKCQTVVFSSMDPADIRTDEDSAWGLRALKGYLKFAKNGALDFTSETGRPPESDFEVAVAGVLRAAGFEVVPQVGVAGYFIDLAVRHPQQSGEYILGVECDGATYHSARSVRDRDILRQEILENYKWRIHRIWSLDWFRNPKRETERLLKVIREVASSLF